MGSWCNKGPFEGPWLACGYFNTYRYFGAMDNMRWQGDSQGKLTVKTACRDLNQSNNQVECWPWKMIWRFKIPNKVVYFFTLVLLVTGQEAFRSSKSR